MRKFTQKALSLLTLACLGSQAHAVGLGNIEVSSKLNQPLNARIKLMSIPRQDIQNLGNIKVRLASAEAFKRAGLERPPVLANLRFNVEGAGDTSADIRISSSQPIKEPFVNFLLEVDWPNGRILREYTVLLDPPLYKAESVAPIPKAKATVSEESEATVAPVKSKKAITSRPANAPLPDDVPVTGETYTVKKGDSLAGIANKMRSGSGTNQREMMQAIFDANPDAFINRNINRLRSGVVLQTPALNGEAADQSATVVTNKAQLNEYRDQAAETPETAPITTAQAPKKVPRPKPAAVKRPLEISGANEEGSGTGSKGEAGDLSRRIQEVIEENKRIQQENKNLKEELVATKTLVDSMKNQIDALIKVQNDTLARLEQQSKGGQTAGATVAATAPKIEPPKTEIKSDTSKTPETVAKTDVKPADAPKPADSGWDDKPKTDVKTDTSKTPETVAKTDVKKDDWGTPDASKSKTETKSDGLDNAKKPDVKVEVAQASDAAKKPVEDKKDDKKPADEKKDSTKPAETPKADAPKPTLPSEGDKGKTTTPVKAPPPPQDVGIVDSALIMASDLGNMADSAVSAVPGGWMTVGGGVGVPLLAGLGWGAYRKRRKEPEEELPNEEDDDELLQHGKDEFSDRELELDDEFADLDGETTSFVGSDEVLDEVDVYVEYERYEQALETLNHALEQRPNHEPYLIKRLEIDAATGNTQAFEEHAKVLHSVTGNEGDSWRKAQALWTGISDKPLNLNTSSVSASPKESSSGGMGLGTAAAIGLGAAGLAAAGLAAAGAFGGEGKSESAGGGEDDFDSLNMNNLEDEGGELDFSSLDASDASDLDFNLSAGDENETQTLDMDGLDLGDESNLSSDDGMNFSQDFNLEEPSSNDDMNFLLNQDDSHDLNFHEEPAAESLDLSLDTPEHEEMDLSMNLGEDLGLDDFNLNLEETPASEPVATVPSSQPEEDMSFLLDDSGLDLSLDEEQPAEELKSSELEQTAALDLSSGDDFLLDDSSLNLDLDEEQPIGEFKSSESEQTTSSDLSLSDDFLLDDSGLDLSLDEEQPAEELKSTEPEQTTSLDLSLGDDFLLDDSGLDLASLEETPVTSIEETHGGGEELSLSDNFIDDAGIEYFGNDLRGETFEEPALETETHPESEFSLNDDLSLSDLTTEDISLETPQETSHNDLSLEEDSFNLDMGEELSLDTLNEETALEETTSSLNDDLSLADLNELTSEETSLEAPQEALDNDLSLDDSFNLDMGDELSLDALNEEASTETAQTLENEFSLDDDLSLADLNELTSEENSLETSQETLDNDLSLDDSFNLDMNDELSLDALSEEPALEETTSSLDDDFGLEMGSLTEDSSESLEIPVESNTNEEDFKLDDDFSDFNLGLGDTPQDDLELSLSADEQALLGDDFTLDLDGNFNLDMGDDIESKFDLVQMYLESDDLASAQSTLEEIMKSGSPDQQARAKEVLEELGGLA